MISFLNIVNYKTALQLKECDFTWNTRLYYHNNFCDKSTDIINDELEYRGYSTLEMTGDASYSFSNKYNKWRVAAPYIWQVMFWCLFNPTKCYKLCVKKLENQK